MSVSDNDPTALLARISMEEKDLDDVIDELMEMLETSDTSFHGNPVKLREFVAQFIVERYTNRYHWLSPAMNKDLVDLGLLEQTHPNEDSLPSHQRSDLTNEETSLVTALNGYLSRAQTGELTQAIRNRNLVVNARVIASLTWRGLSQLRALIEKAIEVTLDQTKIDPAVEAELEALQEQAPFFPSDEDDWRLDTLDAKRMDTEQWLLALVDFSAQVQPPPPSGRKFNR